MTYKLILIYKFLPISFSLREIDFIKDVTAKNSQLSVWDGDCEFEVCLNIFLKYILAQTTRFLNIQLSSLYIRGENIIMA